MSLNADALSLLCILKPPAITDLCIPFPGGAELCPQQGLQSGDPSETLRSLLSSANAALLPLQPFFTVIGVVKAIIDCIQAIPDTLGPPPDPTALANCIPNLLEQVEKLLKMLPQYSVPLMIKRLILLVATTLAALKGELLAIIKYQERILAAATAANLPGNELLASILDCANSNASTTLANLNASMQPLQGLIAIMNILLEAIGQQPIGALPDMSGGADQALEPIDAFIGVLNDIADAIPG